MRRLLCGRAVNAGVVILLGGACFLTLTSLRIV